MGYTYIEYRCGTCEFSFRKRSTTALLRVLLSPCSNCGKLDVSMVDSVRDRKAQVALASAEKVKKAAKRRIRVIKPNRKIEIGISTERLLALMTSQRESVTDALGVQFINDLAVELVDFVSRGYDEGLTDELVYRLADVFDRMSLVFDPLGDSFDNNPVRRTWGFIRAKERDQERRKTNTIAHYRRQRKRDVQVKTNTQGKIWWSEHDPDDDFKYLQDRDDTEAPG